MLLLLLLHAHIHILRSCETLRSWPGHLFPIVSLAVVGSSVYSLGEDGCIRGWPSTAPQQPFVTAWQVERG